VNIVPPDDLADVLDISNLLLELFADNGITPQCAVASMFVILKRMVEDGTFCADHLRRGIDLMDPNL
jgi:hypothetical protein